MNLCQWLFTSLGLATIFSLGVGACSCGETTSIEDLEQPTFVWTYYDGNCSTIHAMDAQGRIWFDHGCEDGGTELSRNGSRDITAVTAAFAALPWGTPRPDFATCSGRTHEFEILTNPVQRTGACATNTQGDASDLTSPWREAAVAVK